MMRIQIWPYLRQRYEIHSWRRFTVWDVISREGWDRAEVQGSGQGRIRIGALGIASSSTSCLLNPGTAACRSLAPFRHCAVCLLLLQSHQSRPRQFAWKFWCVLLCDTIILSVLRGDGSDVVMLVHVTMLFPGRVEEYNSGFYKKKSQIEHSNRTLKSVRSANEVMLQQAIALMTSNGESLNSGRRSAQESITSSYLGSFISAYTIVDISYRIMSGMWQGFR